MKTNILSDNISIMYEGILVATGSATHGKNYEILQVATKDDDNEQNLPTWQKSTSYKAILKILELQKQNPAEHKLLHFQLLIRFSLTLQILPLCQGHPPTRRPFWRLYDRKATSKAFALIGTKSWI